MTKSLLLSFIVLAFCLIYTADTRLDPLNGDPVVYLHAAETLRDGQGLRNPTFGSPKAQAITGQAEGIYATWPPLYPMALALLGGGLFAARLINTLGLWASLLMGYALMRRYGAPVSVAVGAGVAFVLFISDGQITFQTAASEPLFTPLFLAWILTLPDTDTTQGVLLNSLLAMAMALTRYIGVLGVGVTALYVGRQRGPIASLAAAYAPSIVLVAWFTRNLYTVGKLTGHSLPGDYSGESVWQLLSVLNLWLMLVIASSGGLFCLSLGWRRFARRIWS